MESIAIDGPSGVGKSTVAKMLAARLGMNVFDSGAIYRTVAISAKRSKIDINDEHALVRHLEGINITVKHDIGGQHTFLNGEDVTSVLKLDGVGEVTSKISALPKVRLKINEVFKKMGIGEGYVIEGRDVGSYMIPHAKMKFFLTASVEVRAKRRYEQYLANGEHVEFAKVMDMIEKRDVLDTTRAVAPLKKVEDAVLIDSSSDSAEETVNKMLVIIKKCLKI